MLTKHRKLPYIFLSASILLIGSVMFYNRAFSYNDTITHPSLTENVARVYNQNSSNKLSAEEIGWLKLGSIEEDFAPRWRFHFYDSESDAGLFGALSSKKWSQSELSQVTEFGGNQTWQKAINSYVSGNKKESFVALGHVLHLLADTTVPAHTRLDSHPDGDPFEAWVQKKGALFTSAPLFYLANLNEYFDSLSNYSGQYFFSRDKIGPTIKGRIDTIILENGKSRSYLISQDDQNKAFKLALVESGFANRLTYFVDDPLVHSDYYNLLAPKAVSYGAGVIKLFFEEVEKKKKEQEQKSWWQKAKEGFNNFIDTVSGSLYAGFNPSLSENGNSAPSETQQSQTPPAPLPSSKVVSAESIIAREENKIDLPENAIQAQEKQGGDILEETSPKDKKIPPEITEEKNPNEAKLPTSGGNPSQIPGAQDTISPNTTIISGPFLATASTTAIFVFESSEANSTFACVLDNASSTPCSSPKEYPGLADGSHTFKVSATDQAGNEDLSSAEYSWAVDTGAPEITNIFEAPGRTSGLISWTSSEPGVFSLEYGTSTSYGFVSATTTAFSINILSLAINTSYHYRILGQDNAGNSTTTADNIFTTGAQAENIVISEIQISGSTADDEFVELYNPTSNPINILGWKLARRTATATSSYENLVSSFPSVSIPAHGYFLVTHPTGYDGGVPGDVSYSSDSYYIAPDNAVLLYSDAGDTLIDMVGFGMAVSFEGVTAANPAANQSVERKALATSTAATLFNGVDKWSGNGYDSDDNSRDFVSQSNISPQNSLMLAEPRSSLPILMDSAWPTWQGNLFRSGSSDNLSLATSSMAVKWTATTTATHEFISRPVLDVSGNIYIGRADGLAKYSSAGILLWLYGSGSTSLAPLLLEDGSVIARISGGLIALDQNGQLKWKISLPATVALNAQMAVLSDGTIITQSSEKIYALNQDATVKWIFDPGRALGSSNNITAFVVDSANNIYLGIDNYIYAISPVGILLWEINLGSSYSSLSLGNSGDLYASAAGIAPSGSFCSINISSGLVNWCDAAYVGTRTELAPAIDSSGQVYSVMFYGNGDKKLQQYNATSTPVWRSVNVSISLAAPILTIDDKIYLSDGRAIKIFDAGSGDLLYTFSSPDGLNFYELFGAVGPDGVIYTANSSTLYAIGDT